MNKWKMLHKLMMTDDEARNASYRMIAHSYRPLIIEKLYRENKINRHLPVDEMYDQIYNLVMDVSRVLRQKIDEGALDTPHTEDPIVFLLKSI